MSLQEYLNLTPMNKGMIRPIRPVGIVILNGRLSTTDVAMACSNKTPLYPHASGVYRSDEAVVWRGEIAFQFQDRSAIGLASYNGRPNGSDAISVEALTALNGQGLPGETREMMGQRIRVIGLVEVGTDTNKTTRFNIVIGGVNMQTNNGNQDIVQGDSIVAYLPKPEELKRCAADDTKARCAGDARLWFAPMNAAIHRNQPIEVYNCLMDTKREKPYLDIYRQHAMRIYDAQIGLGVCMIIAMTKDAGALAALRRLVAPGATEEEQVDAASMLLAQSGHTEFPSPQRGIVQAAEMSLKKRIIDTIFVIAASDSQNRAPYLFEDKTPAHKRLRKVQEMAVQQLFRALNYYTEQLNAIYLGRAVTSAKPSEDFVLEIGSYAR
jgi:hypothetical protein